MYSEEAARRSHGGKAMSDVWEADAKRLALELHRQICQLTHIEMSK